MREKLRSWWLSRFNTEEKAKHTIVALFCFWGVVLFFLIWIPYNHFMLVK